MRETSLNSNTTLSSTNICENPFFLTLNFCCFSLRGLQQVRTCPHTQYFVSVLQNPLPLLCHLPIDMLWYVCCRILFYVILRHKMLLYTMIYILTIHLLMKTVLICGNVKIRPKKTQPLFLFIFFLFQYYFYHYLKVLFFLNHYCKFNFYKFL